MQMCHGVRLRGVAMPTIKVVHGGRESEAPTERQCCKVGRNQVQGGNLPNQIARSSMERTMLHLKPTGYTPRSLGSLANSTISHSNENIPWSLVSPSPDPTEDSRMDRKSIPNASNSPLYTAIRRSKYRVRRQQLNYGYSPISIGQDYDLSVAHQSQGLSSEKVNSPVLQTMQTGPSLTRLDHQKTMELSIIDLVVKSVASRQANTALSLAKNSLKELNSLKSTINSNILNSKRELRPGSQSSLASSGLRADELTTSIPMTTGISLLDLALMVNSNLACQMGRSGHHKESIELYLQLSKMAQSSSSSNFTSSRQILDMKPLLYRFGFNVGNLYYEKGDYQLALKYYRLTLDRLSSVSECKNLRIKLMNNISLALIAMKQLREAINTLDTLLSDNLTQVDDELLVCNGYHHSYGLNLMICLSQQANLSAMMNTLKGLTSVNICHHFQLANPLKNVQTYSDNVNFNIVDKVNQAKDHKDSNLASKKDSDSVVFKLIASSVSSQSIVGFDQKTFNSNNTWQPDLRELRSKESANQNQRELDYQNQLISNTDLGKTFQTSHLNDTSNLIKLPLGDHVAGLNQSNDNPDYGDRLEILVLQKQKEISRAIILSCNLILDIDNQVSNDSNNKSTMNFCSNLLVSSPFYKSLIYDLKTNGVSKMLERRHGLGEAVSVLEKLTGSKDAAHNSQSNKNKEDKLSSIADLTPKSAMVATNFCLLHLLYHQAKEAINFGENALKLCDNNIQTFINLANCYYQISDYSKSIKYYQLALQVDPFSWEANYNLGLVNRRIGKHYDELPPSTKRVFAIDRQIYSHSPKYNWMILAVAQLALIYESSQNFQLTSQLLNELIKSSRSPPELYLMASKAVSNNANESLKPQEKSPLKQAIKEHPYHIPTAERLIALYIQDFNYEAARLLIGTCARNRPDQVNWYQMLAECYRRATDYDKAISIYEYAIDIFPQDTGCLKALVKLTGELGIVEKRIFFENKLNTLLNHVSSHTTR